MLVHFLSCLRCQYEIQKLQTSHPQGICELTRGPNPCPTLMCSLLLWHQRPCHIRDKDFSYQLRRLPMIRTIGQCRHRPHQCLTRVPDGIPQTPSFQCRTSISRCFTPRSSKWPPMAMETKRSASSKWLNKTNKGCNGPAARNFSSMEAGEAIDSWREANRI